MKLSRVAVFAFFLLANGTILLRAQTPAPAPAAATQPSHDNGMIAFLTPVQQEQYAKAHAKALADNPALKAEGEALKKQILANGEHQDQATIERMNSHRQKLRQAMLKEDPTLGPVFAEIDKHISEAKAKQLGQLQNSGTTNAPSSR
jgi:acyl transferase domain-containing protein